MNIYVLYTFIFLLLGESGITNIQREIVYGKQISPQQRVSILLFDDGDVPENGVLRIRISEKDYYFQILTVSKKPIQESSAKKKLQKNNVHEVIEKVTIIPNEPQIKILNQDEINEITIANIPLNEDVEILLNCPVLKYMDVYVQENQIIWTNSTMRFNSFRTIKINTKHLGGNDIFYTCKGHLDSDVSLFTFNLKFANLERTIIPHKDFIYESYIEIGQPFYGITEWSREFYYSSQIQVASVIHKLAKNWTLNYLLDKNEYALIRFDGQVVASNSTSLSDILKAKLTFTHQNQVVHPSFDKLYDYLKSTIRDAYDVLNDNTTFTPNISSEIADTKVNFNDFKFDLITHSNNYEDLINKVSSYQGKFPRSRYMGIPIETNQFKMTPSGSLIYEPKNSNSDTFQWADFVKEERTNAMRKYGKIPLANSDYTLLEYDPYYYNTNGYHKYLRYSFNNYGSANYRWGLTPTMGAEDPLIDLYHGNAGAVWSFKPYSVLNYNSNNNRDLLVNNIVCSNYFYGHRYVHMIANKYSKFNCELSSSTKTKKCWRTDADSIISHNKRLNIPKDKTPPTSRAMKFVNMIIRNANTNDNTSVNSILQQEIYRRIFEYQDLLAELPDQDRVKDLSIQYFIKILKNQKNKLNVVGNEYYLAKNFIEAGIKNSPSSSSSSSSTKDDTVIIDLLEESLPKIKPQKPRVFDVNYDYDSIFKDEMIDIDESLKQKDADFRKNKLDKLLTVYNKHIPPAYLELKLSHIMPIIQNQKVREHGGVQQAMTTLWIFTHIFTLGVAAMVEAGTDTSLIYNHFTVDSESADQFRERRSKMLISKMFDDMESLLPEDISEVDKRILLMASILRLCKLNTRCPHDTIIKSMLLMISYDDKILDESQEYTKAVRMEPYFSTLNFYNSDIIPQAIILMANLNDSKFSDVLYEELTEMDRISLYNINTDEVLALTIPCGFDVNTKNNKEVDLPIINAFTTSGTMRLNELYSKLAKADPGSLSHLTLKTFQNDVFKVVLDRYRGNSYLENLKKVAVKVNSNSNTHLNAILSIDATISDQYVVIQKKNQPASECININQKLAKSIASQGFTKSMHLKYCLRLDTKFMLYVTLKDYLYLDKFARKPLYAISYLIDSIKYKERFRNVICEPNFIDDASCYLQYNSLTRKPHKMSILNQVYAIMTPLQKDSVLIYLPVEYKIINKQSAEPVKSSRSKVLTYREFIHAEYNFRVHVLNQSVPMSRRQLTRHYYDIINFNHVNNINLDLNLMPDRKIHKAFEFEHVLKDIFEGEKVMNDIDYGKEYMDEVLPKQCQTLALVPQYFSKRNDRLQSFTINYNNMYKKIISPDCSSRWCNLMLAKLARINYFHMATAVDPWCVDLLHNSQVTSVMYDWVVLNTTRFIPVTGSIGDKVEFMANNVSTPFGDFYVNHAKLYDDKNLTLIVDKNAATFNLYAAFLCYNNASFLYEAMPANTSSLDVNCTIGRITLKKWLQTFDALFGVNFANQRKLDLFFQNLKLFSAPSSYRYIPEMMRMFENNVPAILAYNQLVPSHHDSDDRANVEVATLDTLLNVFTHQNLHHFNSKHKVTTIRYRKASAYYKLMNYFNDALYFTYNGSIDTHDHQHIIKRSNVFTNNYKKEDTEISYISQDDFIYISQFKIATLDETNIKFLEKVRTFIYETNPTVEFADSSKIKYSNDKSELLFVYLYSLAYAYENYDDSANYKKHRTRELEFLSYGISGMERKKALHIYETKLKDIKYAKNDDDYNSFSDEEFSKVMSDLLYADLMAKFKIYPTHFLVGIDVEYVKMMRNSNIWDNKKNHNKPLSYVESVVYSYSDSVLNTLNVTSEFTGNIPYLFYTKNFKQTSFDPSLVFGTQEIFNVGAFIANIVMDLTVSVVLLPVGGPILSKIGKGLKNMSTTILRTFKTLGNVLRSISLFKRLPRIPIRMPSSIVKNFQNAKQSIKQISIRNSKSKTSVQVGQRQSLDIVATANGRRQQRQITQSVILSTENELYESMDSVFDAANPPRRPPSVVGYEPVDDFAVRSRALIGSRSDDANLHRYMETIDNIYEEVDDLPTLSASYNHLADNFGNVAARESVVERARFLLNPAPPPPLDLNRMISMQNLAPGPSIPLAGSTEVISTASGIVISNSPSTRATRITSLSRTPHLSYASLAAYDLAKDSIYLYNYHQARSKGDVRSIESFNASWSMPKVLDYINRYNSNVSKLHLHDAISTYQHCNAPITLYDHPNFRQNLGDITPDLRDSEDYHVGEINTLLARPEMCSEVKLSIVPKYLNAKEYKELYTFKTKDGQYITPLVRDDINHTISEDGLILSKYHIDEDYYCSVSNKNGTNIIPLVSDYVQYQNVPDSSSAMIITNVALTYIDHQEYVYITPLKNVLQSESLFDLKLFLHYMFSTHSPYESFIMHDDLSYNEDGACSLCIAVDTTTKIGSLVQVLDDDKEEEEELMMPQLWKNSHVSKWMAAAVVEVPSTTTQTAVYKSLSVSILLFLIPPMLILAVWIWYNKRKVTKANAEQHELAKFI